MLRREARDYLVSVAWRPFVKSAVSKLAGGQELPHELQKRYVYRICRHGTSEHAYTALMSGNVTEKDLQEELCAKIGTSATLEQVCTIVNTPGISIAPVKERGTEESPPFSYTEDDFTRVLKKHATVAQAYRLVMDAPNLPKGMASELVGHFSKKWAIDEIYGVLRQKGTTDIHEWAHTGLVEKLVDKGTAEQAYTLLREGKVLERDQWMVTKVISEKGTAEQAYTLLREGKVSENAQHHVSEAIYKNKAVEYALELLKGGDVSKGAQSELVYCVAEHGSIGQLLQLPDSAESFSEALGIAVKKCTADEAYTALTGKHPSLEKYMKIDETGASILWNVLGYSTAVNYLLDKIYREGTVAQVYDLIMSSIVSDGGSWHLINYPYHDHHGDHTLTTSTLYPLLLRIVSEGTLEQAKVILESGKAVTENSLNLLEHRVHGKPLKPLHYYC